MLRTKERAASGGAAAAVDRHVGHGYRVVASTVVGVVMLAILGAVAGPQWDPVPLSETVVVESSSTAIGRAAPVPTYDVRTSVVTVQLDGASVDAQISEPVGLDGPKPGVVFVHGAGTGRYDTAFREQAHALAASGIVAMVPNKRLDTYTTRHRDYVAMAADYEASVAVLQEREGVDPDAVGIYAESEGGWIAPIMAAQDPSIGFVVLVSSPVVPPREQAAFAVDAYLRNTGVPHGVFRAIPRAVGMSFPGGGFEYADFDVTPYQEQMDQPVLVVYGTGDASMPIVQGALLVIEDTAVAGNDDVTVRYYEGANHGIRVGGTVSPEFLRDLSGWVLGLPATGDAAPQIAGAQPEQTYLAEPVPSPRWFGDGDAVVALAIAAVGLIVLGPLAVAVARGTEAAAAGVRRRRGSTVPATGHRFAPGVLPGLSALGFGAILTVVGLVWYIASVAQLALDYERNALVVRGGWILVRVLGIAVVLAGVLLLRRCRRVRLSGEQPAPGILRTVVLWAGIVGSVVLLLLLAYWGVFQLGI